MHNLQYNINNIHDNNVHIKNNNNNMIMNNINDNHIDNNINIHDDTITLQ